MPSIISLHGVSLDYEGKRALRNIYWDVRAGEGWALVGPNGAGKTSLLSIINGYRWPTTGEVEVIGERFGESDLRELRKRVGFVSAFLNDWIPPDERVIDLVVGGKYGSTKLWKTVTPAERKKAMSFLETMGCAEDFGKRVNELSQGGKQKVMVARMLMSETKLLVLDEPCDGLDLEARESFLSSMGRLAEARTLAIIYVTHRTDEIPPGFTHALLLKSGRVSASGKIGSVLTAANLSRCFGVKVKLHRFGGRYYSMVDGGDRET